MILKFMSCIYKNSSASQTSQTNPPSVDCSQYHAKGTASAPRTNQTQRESLLVSYMGKKGWWLLSVFLRWMECAIMICAQFSTVCVTTAISLLQFCNPIVKHLWVIRNIPPISKAQWRGCNLYASLAPTLVHCCLGKSASLVVKVHQIILRWYMRMDA